MEVLDLGRVIHPAFFDVIRPFKLMKKSWHDGIRYFISPMAEFTLDGTIISAEDKNFLLDIKDIIDKTYNFNIERESARNFIERFLKDNVCVINVGNVFYKNDYFSGWEGGINAVWSDNNCPGKLINIHHSFFQTSLIDAKERDEFIKYKDSYINLLEILDKVRGQKKRVINNLLDKCPIDQS